MRAYPKKCQTFGSHFPNVPVSGAFGGKLPTSETTNTKRAIELINAAHNAEMYREVQKRDNAPNRRIFRKMRILCHLRALILCKRPC